MKDVKEGIGCCWSHTAKYVGIAFVLVATLLTLFTLDGFGIFGMFLVGLVLLRKSCCSWCHCGCSKWHDDESCSMPKEVKAKVSKATKSTKKTTAE